MSERQSTSTSAAQDDERPGTSTASNIVKGTVAGTAFVTLAAGLRSAWKYSRFEEAKHLKQAEVFSGVGFATRALALATCITVSGFTLAVVGVSWLLSVNTPRQFGAQMKEMFGDTLRLESSKKTVSTDEFEKLLMRAVAPKAVEANLEEKKVE